jgi:hypothetical protein
MNAWTDVLETWYVYHGSWLNLSGIIHKSLLSIVPTLQFTKFLIQNLDLG